MLNGRFDLEYERHDFTGSPFADTATNALRSYHHFLFLSRESADDPCGLSLEVLTLQFWEVHCPRRPRGLPVHVLVSGGKILVPFGADPLYPPELRRSGRLRSEDPAARLGAGGRGRPPASSSAGALALTDDLYRRARLRAPQADARPEPAERLLARRRRQARAGEPAGRRRGGPCRPGTRPTTTRSGSAAGCSCRRST